MRWRKIFPKAYTIHSLRAAALLVTSLRALREIILRPLRGFFVPRKDKKTQKAQRNRPVSELLTLNALTTNKKQRTKNRYVIPAFWPPHFRGGFALIMTFCVSA